MLFREHTHHDNTKTCCYVIRYPLMFSPAVYPCYDVSEVWNFRIGMRIVCQIDKGVHGACLIAMTDDKKNETRKTREIQETRSQHKGSHRSTIMPYYHIGRNELICVAHPSTRRMAKLSLHRLRPDTTHTCVADRAWIRDILRRPAEHEQYAVGDILWDTRLQLTGSVIIHCSLKMTCMHIYYILFFAATIANDYEHKPQKKVFFLFDVTCELFMLKSIVTQE